MKRSILRLALPILGLAIGCASTTGGPPLEPARVTETEVAIRAAENAGAAERAADLLGRAQEALVAARRASSEGNNAEASVRIDEARAFAAAAEARARAEKARAEAAHARQQADELETRIRQLKEEARSEGRQP